MAFSHSWNSRKRIPSCRWIHTGGLGRRKGLEKQIRQMKQENMVLEEANARYSKLQLIEAQVGRSENGSYPSNVIISNNNFRKNWEWSKPIWVARMRILCFVSEIDRLEKEVDASKAKIADLEQTNEKTLSEVKAKEEAMKDLQKELRTIRYAYMKWIWRERVSGSVIAPSFHSSPSSFDKLSLPVCMEIFSYLDVMVPSCLSHSQPQRRIWETWMIVFIAVLKMWRRERKESLPR